MALVRVLCLLILAAAMSFGGPLKASAQNGHGVVVSRITPGYALGHAPARAADSLRGLGARIAALCAVDEPAQNGRRVGPAPARAADSLRGLGARIAALCALRLYLKDGGYHIVREYHVEGDRVRFFSTERDEWEEMPVALVDLEKTDAIAKQNAAEDLKEQRAEDAEDQALREQQREIASVPMETGAYYRAGNDIKRIDGAQYQVVTNKRRAALKMLSPIPLVPGKATVVIKGEHSAFVVHDDRPTFYFRPEKEEQFTIIGVEPKKGMRVVENVSILPAVNVAVEDRRIIKVFQLQLAGNLYKVWPEKPLPPGEYAIAEFSDSDTNTKDDLDLLVWDFAYQPVK